ncbi:MAG: glycoside hydrolase family 97 protein [Chitinophagaceae bacterium]|nr:MAG: glycoside hydrolase family 97 protein [Chitinophagaceae bacterium]
MKKYFCLAMLIISAFTNNAQQSASITSPDRAIKFHFQIISGKPHYSVEYRKKLLLAPGSLGLEFADSSFTGSLKALKAIKNSAVESYTMTVGKASAISEPYNEMIIPLQETAKGKRIYNLHIRIFNDGLGFRYEIPASNEQSSYTLLDENTSFNFSGDPSGKLAFLENYTTSHEHRYKDQKVTEIKDKALIDLPALFTFNNGPCVAITESNLLDYAGMSLTKKDGILKTQLTPLPGQTEEKVKAKLPHHSPWRLIMIAEKPGDLVKSNLVTNFAEPSRVKDVSWLKPGKATFHWWSGDVLPDTTFEAGINFNFNKYYIDFCARNGIQFHTVIGNRGVAWYQNDGNEYQPGPNTDITKPRTGLEIEKICEYAKSKGVGIRFWVHWQALYPKIDTAFALFEKWGIAGMMVDFMDRDDQQMINIQQEILEKAAKHHLEIQFHGVSKPTGLNRTYPNESTREGTLNYENNKWGILITPDDDINVVFTRLLAGPTDYHLGGFNAMSQNKFKVQFTKPHMLGTRCHMLAMYLVLENSMSMICDYPEAYENQPGFELLSKMPTTWDQTIVPGAELNKWIAIARRKSKDWYLGSITNNEGREVAVKLDFLPEGKFKAEVYSDGNETLTDPNKLEKKLIEVDRSTTLNLRMMPGGGQVIHIYPAQ